MLNREAEAHFALNPSINIRRSIFNQSYSHKTTFDAGQLIPICQPIEVLPGDTIKCGVGAAVRMTTPIFPVMDDAFLDVFWFYVPNRLVWEHWQEFCGENKTSYWDQQTTYTVPQTTAPSSTGWTVGTIADHFGLPVGVPGISVNSMPFRGYCLVWNEFFRSENVSQPANITLGDTTTTGTNSGSYVLNAQCGAEPLPVAKIPDYFTMALPQPQKGPAVTIPGAIVSQMAPVVPGTTAHLTAYPDNDLTWIAQGNFIQNYGYLGYHRKGSSGNDKKIADATYEGEYGSGTGLSENSRVVPSNLYADISGGGTAITINDLREALAIQRMLETDARGGTRYTEILKAHFGVTSPDARLQRPEYLGGGRVRINMDQVLQTSSTDATSPQGNTAAYSLTNMADGSMWTHSFVEHGFVFGLAAVRTYHTYQQGISRFWSRKDKYDYYWCELANIGEQPILRKEVYATGVQAADDAVFGYQEAYADYRYTVSQITGKLRSGVTGSLDSWHYGDYYTSTPYLSHDWLIEDKANVQRTLAVQTEPQFIGDFAFRMRLSRPMPLYSVPGLVGHF